MPGKQDFGKRNIDWLRTLHWSVNDDDYPVESMEQVKEWADERWPGITDEEVTVRMAQMPTFEAAPARLQGEVYSDINKMVKNV